MISQLACHVLTEQTDSLVSVHSHGGWTAAYASSQHPQRDRPNEDALGWFVVDEETAVFAVADGCGGMRGGQLASQLAMQHLGASLEQVRSAPNRMRAAILDGIESANEAIRGLRMGAACTIAVVEYQGGRIRPYHVGDSKILVMGSRGRVRYESICHSPVGFAVESGWLEADEAMHHEDRHLVSNVVGCDRMRIEMGPTIPLGARDTLVIASDGLFDNVSNQDVIAGLRKGVLQRGVTGLMELAVARMHGIEGEPSKPDDISLIAVRGNRLQAAVQASQGVDRDRMESAVKPR